MWSWSLVLTARDGAAGLEFSSPTEALAPLSICPTRTSPQSRSRRAPPRPRLRLSRPSRRPARCACTTPSRVASLRMKSCAASTPRDARSARSSRRTSLPRSASPPRSPWACPPNRPCQQKHTNMYENFLDPGSPKTYINCTNFLSQLFQDLKLRLVL